MEKKVEIIEAKLKENGRERADKLRVAAYCRVSTDKTEQEDSYEAQKEHYTKLIQKNEDWRFVEIYADVESGTKTRNRTDFQRMIQDAQNNEFDMLITKSISRFARNTLDTLNFSRMLKNLGIGIIFETENIDTLTMEGEMLFTILASVAQGEVENTSKNVNFRLQQKMTDGEMVGFSGCLGYDYDKENKTISVNSGEAETVKKIFDMYCNGMGGYVIARKLREMGAKTKRGSTKWSNTTVLGIVKNEKYVGDLLQGKTFTIDPLTKRRLENFGERNQYLKKEVQGKMEREG